MCLDQVAVTAQAFLGDQLGDPHIVQVCRGAFTFGFWSSVLQASSDQI